MTHLRVNRGLIVLIRYFTQFIMYLTWCSPKRHKFQTQSVSIDTFSYTHSISRKSKRLLIPGFDSYTMLKRIGKQINLINSNQSLQKWKWIIFYFNQIRFYATPKSIPKPLLSIMRTHLNGWQSYCSISVITTWPVLASPLSKYNRWYGKGHNEFMLQIGVAHNIGLFVIIFFFPGSDYNDTIRNLIYHIYYRIWKT